MDPRESLNHEEHGTPFCHEMSSISTDRHGIIPARLSRSHHRPKPGAFGEQWRIIMNNSVTSKNVAHVFA